MAENQTKQKYESIALNNDIRKSTVYILSELDGIGKVTAERIYSKFEGRSLKVLEKEPDLLLEIKGITASKLKKISASLKKEKDFLDLCYYLFPYGADPAITKKIYKYYLDSSSVAIEAIEKNPYALVNISGIGFLTADNIGLSLGFEKEYPERIKAGIIEALNKDLYSNGNIFSKLDFLESEVPKILNIHRINLSVYLKELKDESRIMCYPYILPNGQKTVIFYKKEADNAEAKITQKVKELSSTSSLPFDFDSEIKILEKENDLQLDIEQKKAIKMALVYGISVITGGPGTGKSTIIKMICDLYSKFYKEKIALMAPTGKAARRMEDSTGRPSTTIHKLLEIYSDDIDFIPEQIDYKLIIIDEASMIDMFLMQKLLIAAPYGTKLLFLGDVDQLPPVGPGEPFREIIAALSFVNKGNLTRLEKIFRQAEDSIIPYNSKAIKDGRPRDIQLTKDFIFFEADSNNIDNLIAAIYKKECSIYGEDSVAVLSPYKNKTNSGTVHLNEKLREQSNPHSPDKHEMNIGNFLLFRENDRVMETSNKEEVSNGDIGTIESIFDNVIQVNYGDGKILPYKKSDATDLIHSYAITIHKSQGSEYDSVIIPVVREHDFMLKSNGKRILYTAITRAKKRVILVGSRQQFLKSVTKDLTLEKNSNLSKRIIKNINLSTSK